MTSNRHHKKIRYGIIRQQVNIKRSQAHFAESETNCDDRKGDFIEINVEERKHITLKNKK